MRKTWPAIGVGLLTVLVSLGGISQAGASGNPTPIHPDTINQTCDEAVNPTHGEHCIQAAGRGNPITLMAPNGNPNQEFDVFLPGPGNMVCGDDISDPGCPFPGTPVGDQIIVIGGQSNQNAGSCGGWTSLRTQGSLTACNGGTGINFVLDGHAMESAFLGRQTGGKTYLCENPLGIPTVRTVFTAGDCQWSTLPQ
jgi:hypothetical protein